MPHTTGNRCGHKPRSPRFADLARRGPGGHPPVIGIVCTRLEKAYRDPTILPTWQCCNPSGRKRRSETREAAIALGQYVMTHWFQLESRQLATPSGGYLLVPDAQHLARRISQQAGPWRRSGMRLSAGRIQTVFADWIAAGYMTSRQQRIRKPSGDWEACPSVRTLTKRFFLELGGQALWSRVKREGKKKLARIKPLVALAGMTLHDYVSPGISLSPRAAYRLKKQPWFYTSMDPAHKTRNSRPYQQAYTQAMVSLGTRFYLEARPPDRWDLDKVMAVARRRTDQRFGLTD